MQLFPANHVIGVFRGYTEGGLEFHADLAIPYKPELHAIPMHGQFLLVQLETPEEGVLGRITALSSQGKLSQGSGEEFNIRAVREGRIVPDDLREQYLKYHVDIRVLGVLRNGAGNKLDFVPSHRRLPHVGSPVAFPSDEVLKEVVGSSDDGVCIGHFALGEYIYDPNRAKREPWMRLKSPEARVTFNIRELISRRSFIFARAGFGKSNLNKLLFSELYREQPTVKKRGEREVPVGTIIFDPDGEYFWPDDKGRPGLCDVHHLQDKLVVFTSRGAPSRFYQAFVASRVKFDIRELRPSDVISIALPPERQDQQNVTKLRGLRPGRWRELVDLIHVDGNGADPQEVAGILNVTLKDQQAEVMAARSNMTTIVRMLHDPSSQMMGLLLNALREGKLCVVDVSQMRGTHGYVLSGIILRQIFSRNQEEFTKAEPETIPTIAVIEEAQSVLNDRAAAAEPFIAWVKEGRKYDLGAVLVTQQPGSIPDEILSQGDNWFLFHLLSAGDLGHVKKANSHFSNDILSSLLNEPIVGQGIFWSSAKKDRAYPIALRVLSFEEAYTLRDPQYQSAPIATFAATLRAEADVVRKQAIEKGAIEKALPGEAGQAGGDDDQPNIDNEALYSALAKEAIQNDQKIMQDLNGEGVPWGGIIACIKKKLPRTAAEPDKLAYDLVAPTFNALFGAQEVGWHSFRNKTTGKMWAKKGAK
jgi:Helicase HerA, central domain